MALECFSWITQLLCHRYDDDDEVLSSIRRLPACLIIEILTRLPADCLVTMPKTLISSHYFSTLHLARAKPLLIIHDVMYRLGTYSVRKLFVFDESLIKEEEKMFTKVLLKRDLMINEARQHTTLLRYSCAGVLLFMVVDSPPTYFLFNPITQEEVTIQHEFYPGYLCAFYYCPLTRQFKLLYGRDENSLRQYSIYSVRARTWRRKIRCPTPNRSPICKPTIVNCALHLIAERDLEKPDIPPCAEGIMVFNMEKEEFSTMPHPGINCSSWIIHSTTSLLVKDGCLCLCQLFIFENRLDIWILEDYEARLWTKICKVKLVFNNHGVRNMRIVQRSTYWEAVRYLSVLIKPLHFLDGELVFYWTDKGLFMYNMDHKTLRNFEGPKGDTCCTYKKSLLTIA